MAVQEHHRHGAHVHLKLAVITASDSRTPETDESGKLIRESLEQAGHTVAEYQVVPDSPERIRTALLACLPRLDGIIFNGGTGIAPRD
jgi:molybdenum cofactor biosynthesis protein B